MICSTDIIYMVHHDHPYTKEKESSHIQIHGAGSSQHPMNLQDGNRLVLPLGDMSIIVASLKACNQTRTSFA